MPKYQARVGVQREPAVLAGLPPAEEATGAQERAGPISSAATQELRSRTVMQAMQYSRLSESTWMEGLSPCF